MTAAVTGPGNWASNHAEVIYGEHDSGKIVVDEFAGIWQLFLIPQTWEWALQCSLFSGL